MNPGNIPGLNSNSWKYYNPVIKTANVSGTPTQPNVGTGVPEPIGRWTRVANGNMIMAQFQVFFGTSPTKGVGDAYLFELPVKAKRIYEDVTAPQVIGYGLNYHAQTGNAYNQPMIMTLSKYYPSNAGNENYYAECVIAGYGLTFGNAGSITAGNTTASVTHSLGFTPQASDITVAFSGTPLPKMDTVIMGLASTGVTASAARFGALYGAGLVLSSATTGNGGQNVMPCAGTLSNLYVEIATSDASFTRTFAVYKNGAATAVTCTIGTGATTANDTANSVAYVAGDTISIQTTATGTTANTGTISWTLKSTANANTSMLLACGNNNLATGANTYVAAQGSNSDATAANVEQVMPTAGTIKNAYVVLSGTPGALSDYTATLYKNGSPTSLVVVVTAAATTGNDTTHSVTVAAGDKLYWSVVPNVVPPTARQIFISAEFDPTINGESVHMFGGSNNMVNSAARFHYLISGNAITWNATESNRYHLTQAATWKKLYIEVPTATGAAKTWQFQTSINSSAGNPTVTIGNSSTTGNDTTNSAASTVGQRMSMKVTPTGTPAASIAKWGIVSYIAPSAGGHWWLTSIGATTFTVNIREALGADLAFSWKVRAEPSGTTAKQPWILQPTIPWTTGLVQDFFVQVYYEPEK